MKFIAEPNLYVKLNNKGAQRTTGLKGFCFDEKGEYTTENEILIGILKQNFKVKEEYENKQVETVSFKCKKCDFETDNKGELLAHYRKDHPKEV